ncbi:MAG: hypothetical protein RIC38_06355, partial [Chromatocurvus sp.]
MIKACMNRLCGLVFLVLLLQASVSRAAGELIVYTFDGDAPAAGLALVLDGSEEATVRRDGSVSFDLSPGSH